MRFIVTVVRVLIVCTKIYLATLRGVNEAPVAHWERE